MLISVVTPAYCEERNLPVMYERLAAMFGKHDFAWEWIVIDDHSPDGTFCAASTLAARDPRVRCLRLARNSGSHVAILCGLASAIGDCAVVMSSDLQDPPEAIPDLIEVWKTGSQIVWAVRMAREGENASTLCFSRLYWWIMRKFTEVAALPPQGADFVLIDRAAIAGLGQCTERNVSVWMLLTWLGFRQAHIPYVKQKRIHGRSGWTLRKKVELVMDSLVSFSHLPIRLMFLVGTCAALAGFVYALVVFANFFIGKPIEGWSSLMVVVLVVGGLQMLMTGVLGEYVWRGADEARHRPRWNIEAAVGRPPERIKS